MWGRSEFWGLSSDYDPNWVLTDSQKELQKKIIELCRVKLRPHAVRFTLPILLSYINFLFILCD